MVRRRSSRILCTPAVLVFFAKWLMELRVCNSWRSALFNFEPREVGQNRQNVIAIFIFSSVAFSATLGTKPFDVIPF